MILVHETTAGTDVVVPRLNINRSRVVVDLFTNGSAVYPHRYQDQALSDWFRFMEELRAAGFREEPGPPDLRIVLNVNNRTLYIAGGAGLPLDNPNDATPDEPIDSLTDQADAVLAFSGTGAGCGYLRVSNWWADGAGFLTAVIIPTYPTDIPTDVLGAIRAPMSQALASVRAVLAGSTDPTDVAAWVRLCADPMAKGFDHVLRDIRGELREQRRGYRRAVAAADALSFLAHALDRARHGQLTKAVSYIQQGTALVNP